MAYMEIYLKDGLDPLVNSFNLLKIYPDIHGKRKKEFIGEGSSRAHKKKKIVVFLDEDEVPLSEREKAMILKDISGVVQSSSKASDVASGKLTSDSTQFNFDSILSERILPIPHPPSSQSIIFEPIPLPPPQSTFIIPIIETPLVYEPLSE